MRTVAITEFALLAIVCGVLYLVWMQQGQIGLLEADIDRLEGKLNGALPKPDAPKPKKDKPKEPTK
jgi:hypothetical protein